MSIRETLLLGRAEVRRLLSMADALRVVEPAFAAHGRKETRMPAKIYLDLPEFGGDFRAMPAYIPSLKAAGMKWVSSHSRNPGQGRPAVIAVLILSDPETAEPLAVMDATFLTLMRTGAAGGIAAKVLSRADSTCLALIGAGVQSHAQLEAIRSVRAITSVRLHDPNPAARESFHARFQGAGLEITDAPTAAEAVEGADIIVTTTPSRRPVVNRSHLADGVHINAIGADAPGKQELDEAILRDAQVFVDDRQQTFHSGEVNVPLSQGRLKAEEIQGTLGEVVAGTIQGRTSRAAVTVFDSTGLAVQDMAVARAVYERAVEQKAGITFPLACE
ncbi:MAG: ornithine cyclodeaminase family protein [Acidobacteriota bacterium]